MKDKVSATQIAMQVLGKDSSIEPLRKAEIHVLACLVLMDAEKKAATHQDIMSLTSNSFGRAMTTSLIYKVTANLVERRLIESSNLKDERSGRPSTSFKLTLSGRRAFYGAAESLVYL